MDNWSLTDHSLADDMRAEGVSSSRQVEEILIRLAMKVSFLLPIEV